MLSVLQSLRRSLLGEEPQPPLVPSEQQPNPTDPEEKVLTKLEQQKAVFGALIKNIKWHSAGARAGYTQKAFDNWKSVHNWGLLDENLNFFNIGKVIRSFMESNGLKVDLSSVKMDQIPTWYEDMYGIDDQPKDEISNGEEDESEDEDFKDFEEYDVGEIQNQAQSTRLQAGPSVSPKEVKISHPKQSLPGKNSNHGTRKDISMNDLATILQISNGVTLNIEPLRTARDDAKEWFEHYDMITNSYGWTDAIKGLKLPIYLKKDAQRIYKQAPKADREDYTKIKNIICSELMEEERMMMRSSFLQVSQKQGESPSEYGHRLRKFINKLEISLKTDDLVAQFISGLKPELRLATLGHNSKTLEGAIRYAQRASQMMADTGRNEEISSVGRTTQQPHVKGSTTNASNILCYYCAEPGHIKTDCDIYKKVMSLMTCKKCNKKGHITKHCRVSTNGEAPISRDQVRCPQ